MRTAFWLLVLILGLSGCALFKKEANEAELVKNQEFEKALDIKEIPSTPDEKSAEKKTSDSKANKVVSAKPPKKAKEVKGKKVETLKKDSDTQAPKREPELEDSEGFLGRRPIVDPFRVGEKVTLAVSYFGVTAGDMTMETGNFIEVNGRKAYNYILTIKSNPSFAIFYEVNDIVKTFVDHETLLPLGFSVQIRETRDVKENRNVFDWQKMKSTTWTKYLADESLEEKRQDWDILAFSQNVYSIVFYLRNFKLTPGKKLSFRVSDRGKNLIFRGDVLRREKLETKVGTFDTVIVKPEFEMDGAFKPVGDIYLWLTDDDRKFIVKIESKIKLGKIRGEIKELHKGQP